MDNRFTDRENAQDTFRRCCGTVINTNRASRYSRKVADKSVMDANTVLGDPFTEMHDSRADGQEALIEMLDCMQYNGHRFQKYNLKPHETKAIMSAFNSASDLAKDYMERRFAVLVTEITQLQEELDKPTPVAKKRIVIKKSVPAVKTETPKKLEPTTGGNVGF